FFQHNLAHFFYASRSQAFSSLFLKERIILISWSKNKHFRPSASLLIPYWDPNPDYIDNDSHRQQRNCENADQRPASPKPRPEETGPHRLKRDRRRSTSPPGNHARLPRTGWGEGGSRIKSY